MKILPVEQIRQADSFTIKNEPIADIDLMERAGGRLFKWIRKKVDKTHKFIVFSGPGNNGGDSLVLSRKLTEDGYNVTVFIVKFTDKLSGSFKINLERFKKTTPDAVFKLEKGDSFPGAGDEDIIVDGIFGSGLTRPVSGWLAELISHINQSPAIKIAIDIPSGLFTDTTSKQGNGAIVRADYTLTFQFPKYSFLMPENDEFVGRWHVLDIGLHPDFIQQVQVKNFFMLKPDIAPILKERKKFSHKGTFGHALLIAGSYGKMGAAILSAHACLRSGVGLLHTHIPKAGYPIIQTALPEAMVSIDRYEHYFSEIPDLSLYNAIGVGPGLGMEKQSQMSLKLLIQEWNQPLVLDADALNILSENKTWLSFLPEDSILTPHPKEFERLAGKWQNDFEKIEMQRSFAEKYNLIVVLKGANTSICLPSGNCYFNSTGNPGMATAGSGDVLTGIITGLLAQHYVPHEAAILGVYLHGLAGDLAMKKLGQESMLAGDLITFLGKAFNSVRKIYR